MKALPVPLLRISLGAIMSNHLDYLETIPHDVFLAVGSGKILDNGQLLPLTVKVGDKVIFKKYSPDEFKENGEEYLVLSESDIIAILE